MEEERSLSSIERILELLNSTWSLIPKGYSEEAILAFLSLSGRKREYRK